MELLFKLIFMCVKSRGVNIGIYMIYRVSSLWDISMSKLGEIFPKKMRLFSHPCGFTLLPPLRDEHMYLKNDVTKKWLFCLIKGVFEMGLLR